MIEKKFIYLLVVNLLWLLGTVLWEKQKFHLFTLSIKNHPILITTEELIHSTNYFSSSNFLAMVGFLRVSFLIVRSSALLLARRRLSSEESSAFLVFSR